MDSKSIRRIPLSLYVHLPWCVRKCPYCDFNSHESREIPEQRYLQCLLEDLRREVVDLERPIHSVFFGGGTPSLMSGDFYKDFISSLKQEASCEPGLEITLEANPGTVEQHRFDAYRAAGVNRISLGVQSFDEDKLNRLGRIHSSGEAITAMEAARKVGFDRINLDLMHGLPGQTLEQGLADLRHAIELGPEHISWYELTIEPNTAFYNQPPQVPGEDALADLEEAGFAVLRQAGYQRYEISAFSRENEACRHNLNYWQFGDYLGIGAGAHGKVSSVCDSGLEITRYQKTRIPADYMASSGVQRKQVRTVSDSEKPLEFMLNTMRLIDGVSADRFVQRTGLPLDRIAAGCAALQQKGLMKEGPDRIAPTSLGLQYLNDLLEAFR